NHMKKIMMVPMVLLTLYAAAQTTSARLVIRGDDMGYTHSGNQAIVKAYQEGIERSVEVIVASPWFPEAVKLLAENPGIDVGVHLAITSEWDNEKWRPLSDCATLKDPDGYFYPMVYPNKNYPGRSIRENKWTIEDVEKEFRAQIELAIKKIPHISHISSHMGCTDLNDSVTQLARKLAKEYHIDIDPKELGVEFIGYKGPSATSDQKIASFKNMLNQLQAGKMYIFVDHPGLNSPELQAIHHIGYETVAADRQGVTDLWTNPAIKEAIRQKGIELISYADLKK
ncbi:MAG TPA: polysaccharide deacetylase family protein, partial [Puia sp.]|nr:polysaccharide deacetylase family protein [Puia sp.]